MIIKLAIVLAVVLIVLLRPRHPHPPWRSTADSPSPMPSTYDSVIEQFSV